VKKHGTMTFTPRKGRTSDGSGIGDYMAHARGEIRKVDPFAPVPASAIPAKSDPLYKRARRAVDYHRLGIDVQETGRLA
jgi:hypothetical protein